jgi:multisubunit Na+/H+ antiporter MnhF subunit
VNVWLIGATILLVALAPCLLVCLRGSILDAFVALELGTTVMTLALVLLAQGFGRSSYYALPLVLAVLGFVGVLVSVRFLGEHLR